SLNDSLLYLGGHQYEVYRSTPQAIGQSRFDIGFSSSVKMSNNGKIYSRGGSLHMARVNYPNLFKGACDFERYAVPVPDSLDITLAVLPNQVGVLDSGKIQQNVNVLNYNSDCFLPITLGPSYGGTKHEVTWMDSIVADSLSVTESGTYWVRYHDYENC